ncbi:MAG: ABC transporter substrate-binding protein, partial [Anaerolineae bacterium]|nr:ABC transporter substrate-binding protein [Anaerolineae bacterium]
MKNNKWYVLVMMLLLSALILSACGGSTETVEETPTEAAAPAEEAVVEEAPAEEAAPAEETMAGPTGTVSLWHAYGTGSAEEQALAVIVDNARAEYPDLTIDVLQIPFDQIFNKWQTEVAAGEGPDMFI